MDAICDAEPKVIYWHRELPPFAAQPMGEHVEASSRHVPDTIAHRAEHAKCAEGRADPCAIPQAALQRIGVGGTEPGKRRRRGFEMMVGNTGYDGGFRHARVQLR